MYFTVVSLPQISQSIGLTNLQQTHKFSLSNNSNYCNTKSDDLNWENY